jgi:hypothetical protein
MKQKKVFEVISGYILTISEKKLKLEEERHLL